MGARDRCCCGCLIGSDNFRRGDSTDLGGLWTELDGDWAIIDWTLGEAGNEDALVKFNLPAPSENHVVYVDTVDEEPGKIYRVILNYKDENNYHFADFECLPWDPSKGYVRWWKLYKRSAGVNSLLKSEEVLGATLDPPYRTGRTLYVCIGGNPDEEGNIDEQNIYADSTYTVLGSAWASTTTIPDGFYSGLGNGAETIVVYDNFKFYKHRIDDPDCFSCTCTCDGHLWPLELAIRIYSEPGRCPVDQTETLTYDRTDATWKWSGLVTANDGSGRTATFTFTLACMGTMGDDIVLTITSVGSCTATTPSTAVNYYVQKPLPGSVCHPVDLSYKITIESSWLTCSLCGGGLPPPQAEILFYVTELP